MNTTIFIALFLMSAVSGLNASACKNLEILQSEACRKALIVQKACLAADAVFAEPRFVTFNYDTATLEDRKALKDAIEVRSFICGQHSKYWTAAILARQAFEQCKARK